MSLGFRFDALPEELWVAVILEHTTDHKQGFNGVSIELLLPLVLVSTRWRRIIMATPHLWTTVVINDEITDLGMKVATCIHFSKEAPLTLHLQPCIHSWRTVAKHIVPYRSRIRAIRIQEGGPGYPSEFIWDTVIARLMPLPALVSLSGRLWHARSLGTKRIIEENHALVDLGRYHISLQILEEFHRPWFRLASALNPGVILNMMEVSPLLRRVSHVTFPQSISDQSSLDRPTEKGLSDSLDWKSLEYAYQGANYLPTILPGLSNTLTFLEIAGAIPIIFSTVPYLPDLLRLHTLKIRITKDPKGTLPFTAPSISSPSSVRHLMMEIGELRLENITRFKALTTIFPAITPLVERLEISSTDSRDNFEFVQNQRLHHLHHFSVRSIFYRRLFVRVPLSEEPLHLPPSILTVHVQVPDNVFTRLYSSTAEHLEMRSVTGTPKPSIPFELGKWPTVRTLVLANRDYLFTGFSLPHLRKLVLEIGSSVQTHYTTGFCKHIASFPESCPSLEQLVLHQIPEWDIFIIMLERRNFMTESGISRVSRIQLPAFCPPRIRRILVELTQGRVVHRPSNFALSLAGAVDNLCNPSIPGCLECHKALRFCGLVFSDFGTWSRPPVIPYSENVEEILNTWESRAHQWDMIGHERPYFCNRAREDSVYIDEHSFEDARFDDEPDTIQKYKS